ncbi:MAG: tRNA lysidine(34) synthetase TilS [Holosporales bacterium]|jgi:tRNA(Ile)-lysidine synthetase-like protein|nr:tRNA lysidine(34) synthetase TilS [Holosporales bacterium]
MVRTFAEITGPQIVSGNYAKIMVYTLTQFVMNFSVPIMLTSNDFAKIIKQYPYDKKFIVGVSGGADSMALVLLFNEFLIDTFGTSENMTAITIDHRLRQGSEEEAKLVGWWLLQRGIKHEILPWEHGEITSRVEELGRIARYDLMTNFCRQRGIEAIYTAHHAMDQIETFFMRLKRGAGLAGLCAIRPVTRYNNIAIIRPLLNVPPEDLKTLLASHFAQDYVHDPYNDNTAFERCNLRNNMQLLKNIGLQNRSILATVEHLQRLEQQLQAAAQKILESNVQQVELHGGPVVLLERYVVSEHIPQVIKIVLSRILRDVAKVNTLCTQKLLDSLFDKMTSRDFKKTTARHCIIRGHGAFFEFFQEKRPPKY